MTSKDVPSPARPATRKSPPTFVTRRTLLVSTAGIAAAGVAGVVAWRRGLIGGSVPPSGNSVAVLPFDNLSGDPDQAYFSDGLSEEVRATLARNVLLLVMAQTSSGKFRDRKDDARTIAEKLGVAYLLGGSVPAPIRFTTTSASFPRAGSRSYYAAVFPTMALPRGVALDHGRCCCARIRISRRLELCGFGNPI
jgi:hypothetical protein